MKKLSIRKRGRGSYEVGPASAGASDQTVMVNAADKRIALARGKPAWRAKCAREN